ncbi:MAG: di-trans,poly-cis-decaprenylcistransferase [Myxococcales bacterium FL481]|nr:MAG: di-trans,poly-cis-decaprenylcistransferase [Myxococcales bacterium FL481]
MPEDAAQPPADKLPRHVGIIMDGNGRWARSRGLSREEGHSKGADAVRTVVRAARRMGLEALTLYAFSSQNWNRPPQEVLHLMRLLRRYLREERAEIMDNGIRLQTIGDTHRLPDAVRDPLQQLIADSAGNDGMLLCLALSYGGRETLAAAARAACRAVAAGELDIDDLDVERFGGFVPSSQLLPPLDLLIRTSGELRVSNFFLWEVAYAELFFTEQQWPDFGREALVEALAAYASRKRRYGMLDEQVATPNPKLAARKLTPAMREAIESALTGTDEPASLLAAMGKLRP